MMLSLKNSGYKHVCVYHNDFLKAVLPRLKKV